MRRVSLRRTLLTWVARVLERWLRDVTGQLEPVTERQPAPPADPRQPPPPDHWVELVRQHAPQLLDADAPDAADSPMVIDWRADDARLDPPSFTPPNAKPRPLRLQPTQHQPPPAARKTAPAPKTRPLRLKRVAAEALAADDLSAHPADIGAEPLAPEFVYTTARPVETTVPVHAPDAPEGEFAPPAEAPFDAAPAEAVTPPMVSTTAPDAPPVRRRRGLRLPSLRLPMRRHHDAPGVPLASHRAAELPDVEAPREIATAPTQTDHVTPHFSDAAFERQHIRETRSSIPSGTEAPGVPTVRTGAGRGVQPRQQRTSVPDAPPQLVLRPTHVYEPLDLGDITPDLWASLPDPPAEEARKTNDPRYDRLKREQEGRAWSE